MFKENRKKNLWWQQWLVFQSTDMLRLFGILSFHFKYRNGINNTAQLTEGRIFRQKGLVSVHAFVCVLVHAHAQK